MHSIDKLKPVAILHAQVGVGIHLAEKTWEIKRLVEGGSADLSEQIFAGDFLKSIDGKDIELESMKTVRDMLLGPPGSWVSLEVKRCSAGGDARGEEAVRMETIAVMLVRGLRMSKDGAPYASQTAEKVKQSSSGVTSAREIAVSSSWM